MMAADQGEESSPGIHIPTRRRFRPQAFRFRPRPMALTLLAVVRIAAFAQSSGHERVGVDPLRSFELTVSTGLDTVAVMTSRGKGLNIATSLSADLLIAGTWNFCATLPATILAVSGSTNAFPVIAAPGDPELSAGCTSRIGAWRLGADLSWSHPLGVSDTARSEGIDFRSGSGAETLSVLARANRFLDPLSIGASILVTDELPHRSGIGEKSGSLRLKMTLSVMEALNRNAMLGLSVSQSLSSGTDGGGGLDGNGLRYSATAIASLIVTDGHTSLRAGGAINLANPSSQGSVQLTVSRTMKLGREK